MKWQLVVLKVKFRVIKEMAWTGKVDAGRIFKEPNEQRNRALSCHVHTHDEHRSSIQKQGAKYALVGNGGDGMRDRVHIRFGTE